MSNIFSRAFFTKSFQNEIDTVLRLKDEEHAYTISEVKTLEKQIKTLEKQIANKHGDSSVVSFVIDPELNVSLTTKITQPVIDSLVKAEYISANYTHDPVATDVAILLVANELCEQMIMEVNTSGELPDE